MIATAILASIVALVFAALGLAKILAQPAMRERAAHLGFSTAAYRRIGVLESAAALGVALGPAVPVLGGLAGGGLLLLLAGAVTMHLRHRDTARAIAPAIVCAMLVTGYLVSLAGA